MMISIVCVILAITATSSAFAHYQLIAGKPTTAAVAGASRTVHNHSSSEFALISMSKEFNNLHHQFLKIIHEPPGSLNSLQGRVRLSPMKLKNTLKSLHKHHRRLRLPVVNRDVVVDDDSSSSEETAPFIIGQIHDELVSLRDAVLILKASKQDELDTQILQIETARQFAELSTALQSAMTELRKPVTLSEIQQQKLQEEETTTPTTTTLAPFVVEVLGDRINIRRPPMLVPSTTLKPSDDNYPTLYLPHPFYVRQHHHNNDKGEKTILIRIVSKPTRRNVKLTTTAGANAAATDVAQLQQQSIRLQSRISLYRGANGQFFVPRTRVFN